MALQFHITNWKCCSDIKIQLKMTSRILWNYATPLSKNICFYILLLSNYLCSAHTWAWVFFFPSTEAQLKAKRSIFTLVYKAECSSLYVTSCRMGYITMPLFSESTYSSTLSSEVTRNKNLREDYANKLCCILSTSTVSNCYHTDCLKEHL